MLPTVFKDVFDRERRADFFKPIFDGAYDEDKSLQSNKNLISFRQEVDDFFNNIYPHFGVSLFDNNLSPPVHDVDFQEADEQYLIAISAPGKSKDDFKVEIDDSNGRKLIHIFTENTEEKKDNKSGYISKFAKRSYSLRYGLPKNIDEDKVKASYVNGVLNIEIPKKEIKKKHKLISVT